MKALLALLLAAAPAAAQDRPEGVRVDWLRLPSMGVYSLIQAAAEAERGRPLFSQEIEKLQEFYGTSVDYWAVRVTHIDAIAGMDVAQAWGNTIRLPPGVRFTDKTLIHEVCHIWQFQNGGASYLSNSTLAQAHALWHHRNRNVAYRYTWTDGADFDDYNAEQQCDILADLWAGSLKASKSEQERLRAFVKRQIPVYSVGAGIDEAGRLPRRDIDFPEPDGFEHDWRMRGSPQLELRF